MFNFTDEIVFIKTGKALEISLMKALRLVYKCEIKNEKASRSDDRRKHYQDKQFVEKCNPSNFIKKDSVEVFINDILDAVKTANILNGESRTERLLRVLNWFEQNKAPQVNYQSTLTRAFSRVLIQLKLDNAITLSMWYPFFTYSIVYGDLYPKLEGDKLFNHFYTLAETAEGHEQKMYRKMFVAYLSTDWSDFNFEVLKDISEYFTESNKPKNEKTIPKSRASAYKLLYQMQTLFPERDEEYSDEIQSLIHWLNSKKWNSDYLFVDFYENKDELLKEYHLQRRELQKELMKQNRRLKGIAPKEKKPKKQGNNDSEDEFYDDSIPLISQLSHAGEIEEYFVNYQYSRNYDKSWESYAYRGREDVDIPALSKDWVTLYDAWIIDRENNDLEDLKGPRYSFKFLFDYLFFYLPFWIEANPDAGIKVPLTPQDFDRFTFVHRDYFDDTGEILPATLYDLLKRKYGADSGTTKHKYLGIKSFFDFLWKRRKSLQKFLGKGWENPIEESDKLGKNKKKRTPRVAFEQEASPWVLRYFYALDEYGVHLQNLAIKEAFDDTDNSTDYFTGLTPAQLSANRFIDTENEYEGFVPVISGIDDYGSDSGEFRLTRIPNVYGYSEREITGENGEVRKVYLPNLTALRVNITMYETGRRISNTRYIDSELWDHLNDTGDDSSLIYELYINTDKTQSEEMIEPAYMLPRLRAILKLENAYLNLVTEHEAVKKVKYLNRKKTRFPELIPLFRGMHTNAPIAENAVRTSFKWMVYGVQEFINDNDLMEDPASWASYDEDNNVVECEKDNHTFRSTFITNRYPFFPNDINILVSHASLAVSGHYYSPSKSDLKKRFLQADNSLHKTGSNLDNISTTFSFDGSAHIHPESVNSSVRKSFEQDRDRTIKDYGFIVTHPLPTKLDAESKKGIEKLRVSPASQLKWLNTHVCPVNLHCPENIIQQIGASHRCGICPIAAKCIDHIPAIRAEMRVIAIRIKEAQELIIKLKQQPERTDDIIEIQEKRQLDMIELSGWRSSEKYLLKILEQIKSENKSSNWHINMPEMLKLHLELVVPESTERNYLLERIAAVEAYPKLLQKDPTLEAQSKMEFMKIAAKDGDFDKVIDLLSDESTSAINLIASQFKIMVEASGLDPNSIYGKVSKIAKADDKAKLVELTEEEGD